MWADMSEVTERSRRPMYWNSRIGNDPQQNNGHSLFSGPPGCGG